MNRSLCLRGLSFIALLIAFVLGMGDRFVQAQDPGLRWGKGAPFPEPEEELYGVALNGKMYVIGGFGTNGKPATAMVYEYDADADRWTKKKSIPVPVHHQAQTAYNGKIYVFGGCMRPLSGPGMNGWEPVDNAWEYDPAADSWRALAPMPMKRCSAIAAEVGGKIYVIGGATLMENSGETALFGNRPQRVVGTNQVYDPATNTWATRSPMPTTRNHAFAGAVNGKIYVIGGRLGAAHVTASSNTDVVEEYDPARDTWGAVKARMPTPRSGGGVGNTTTGGSTSLVARYRTNGITRRSRRSRRTSRRRTAGSSCRRCRARATEWPARSSATGCTWSAASPKAEACPTSRPRRQRCTTCWRFPRGSEPTEEHT